MDIRDIKILRKIAYAKRRKLWNGCDVAMRQEADARANGKNDDRYNLLKSFRDKYNGQRCFIVATGPSIRIEDLELLKNEYSFGMNSICKLFNQTTWRPTFYGIQDVYVFDKMKDEIAISGMENILISTNIKEKFQVPSGCIEFPLNNYYHAYDAEFGKYHAKFSNDAYSVVWDGYSITYSLIQIAVYMGFKKIYLLGTDCNYIKGGKNHVVESGHIDRRDYLAGDKMMVAYREAYKAMANSDFEIINCTRGGKLEVFRRETLEQVLAEEKQ